MKLLVTGAGGFLGRYVVATAVRRGHQVRAVLRPAATSVPESWRDHPQVEVVRGDLRAATSIPAMLQGVDAVLHLAAAKSGDLYEQFGGTVIATENLLEAMSRAGIDRLVVTSSFAVYEFLRRRPWSLLDEQSPLAGDSHERDEYCQTKLQQERIVREQARAKGWRVVILRPGVVYGRDNLWTARLGMQPSSRLWIRTGRFAPLPLTYVENCAEAVVLAAEYQGDEQALVLNVVDGVTPSQGAYVKALQRHLSPRPRVIPVPWTVMRLLARLAWWTNRLCFGGTAKVPGLLVPTRLHARGKPMRYSNTRIRNALGWSPRYSWQEAIQRSVAVEDHAALPAVSHHGSTTTVKA